MAFASFHGSLGTLPYTTGVVVSLLRAKEEISRASKVGQIIARGDPQMAHPGLSRAEVFVPAIRNLQRIMSAWNGH